jgi:hypothetical protein
VNRRTLLRRTGAVLAAGGLAGCVGGGSGGGDDGTGSTAPDATTAGETTTAGRTGTPTGTGTTDSTATTTPAATTTPGAPRRTSHRGTAPLAAGVTDRTVTDEGSCSSEEGSSASIAFEGPTAVVTGYFSTSVPCYTVDVVESQSTERTYEIAVLPQRMGADGDPVVCQQCLGRVSYEVRIDFESLPDRVVVRHGEKTVKRAER